MSFKQAGRRHVVADVGDEIFRGWLPAVVRRFFTPGARFQKRIRIVDSCGDVFSDPGANPGASIYSFARWGPFTFPTSLRARGAATRHSPPALACLAFARWGPFIVPHLSARSRCRYAALPSNLRADVWRRLSAVAFGEGGRAPAMAALRLASRRSLAWPSLGGAPFMFPTSLRRYACLAVRSAGAPYVPQFPPSLARRSTSDGETSCCALARSTSGWQAGRTVSPDGRSVIGSSGDGGWIRRAPLVAEVLAAGSYFVVVLSPDRACRPRGRRVNGVDEARRRATGSARR